MEPAYLETCPCLAHNRMGLDSFNQPRNGVKNFFLMYVCMYVCMYVLPKIEVLIDFM